MKKYESARPAEQGKPEPLHVLELDDRLEFGSVLIGSDLDADINSNCTNYPSCSSHNDGTCSNQLC